MTNTQRLSFGYATAGLLFTFAAGLGFTQPALAQEARGKARIDVQSIKVAAEVNPSNQMLAATATISFTPLEDRVSTVSFDLNANLNIVKAADSENKVLTPSQNRQEHQLRITYADTLPKGKPQQLVIQYEGTLSGQEESPVYGVKFAAIKPDYTFLLYPSRWFPVNDYTVDRYQAEFAITAPMEFRVVSGGTETSGAGAPSGKKTTICSYSREGLYGSLALVKGEPIRVPSKGANSTIFFRGDALKAAQSWGEEVGTTLGFLTENFGLAPSTSLVLVQTEDGAPNGYAAPGMLFLSPRAIGGQANPRLLANQLTRHWFGLSLTPASRNHLWITNGMARYAELLQVEQAQGAGALESEVKDTFVEAMTVDNPPLIQAARLEDYSPEYWATTAAKGAAVYHMLRTVLGEERWKKFLPELVKTYAGKNITTEEVKDLASKHDGRDMGYFFIQWVESSGAPEFKLEYTVYRTAKGFRIMGKIAQDLDTFRMPVQLKIETEGNPEETTVEVSGLSSDFVVETFGKPKRVDLDANNRLLRMSKNMRIAVAIRRGEMFKDIGEYGEALREFQKALEVNRNSSLAHYRVGEVFFLQNNYQSAANEFREVLNGDIEPKWTEVWSHIFLGKIFDVTGQRDRAVNEYNQAIRTKDNTQGAQEEAAKLLRSPYKRERPTV